MYEYILEKIDQGHELYIIEMIEILRKQNLFNHFRLHLVDKLMTSKTNHSYNLVKTILNDEFLKTIFQKEKLDKVFISKNIRVIKLLHKNKLDRKLISTFNSLYKQNYTEFIFGLMNNIQNIDYAQTLVDLGYVELSLCHLEKAVKIDNYLWVGFFLKNDTPFEYIRQKHLKKIIQSKKLRKNKEIYSKLHKIIPFYKKRCGLEILDQKIPITLSNKFVFEFI